MGPKLISVIGVYRIMKFKAILIVAFVLAFGPLAHAQLAPTRTQSSTSAEGSHVFSGTTLLGIAVTWQTATTARYLMIFDGVAVPSNGATTSCTSQGTTPVTGCLAWCGFFPNSTSAPNLQTVDFTTHPLMLNFGIVAAMSTGAGCGTLTADTTSNFFTAQTRY